MDIDNKISIDVHDPDRGWVECWKCLYCNSLFPITFMKCPYCQYESPPDNAVINTIKITKDTINEIRC